MTHRRALPLAALLLCIAVAPFLPAIARGEIFVLRDHFDFFAPLRYFTSSALSSGELPLWNPYNGSGERWLANPETAVFYPPAWIFTIVPFVTAYALFLAFHIAMLGLGCFVLFRRRTSDAAAMFGAVAVMLSGPVLSLLDVTNGLTTLTWIPWVTWAACDLAVLPLFVPVAALTLLFLGGEPALAPIAILAFMIVAASVKRSGKALSCVVLAACVSAVQLVPFAEMLIGSDRSGAQEIPLRGTMTARDFLAMPVSPALPGDSLEMFSSSQEFLLILYLAPIVLFFAFLAVVGIRRLPDQRRAIVGWASFVAMMTALSMIPPDVLPLTVNRYPAKFVPLAVLGISALAVIGLQNGRRLTRTSRLIAIAAVTAFIALALVTLEHSSPTAVLIHASVAVSWVVLGLFFAFFPERMSGTAAAITLTLVLAIDASFATRALFRSAPFRPAAGTPLSAVSPSQKIMRLLDPALVARRELNRRAWATGYQNLYLSRSDVSSPAPVVSKKYLALIDATMSRPRQDIAEWLSAGYILTTAPLHGATLQPIGGVSGVGLFRDYRSLPMAALWGDAIIAPTDDEARATLLAGRFDAAQRIVVTNSEALHGFAPPTSRFRARARVLRLRLNRVDVETQSERAVILSLNQLRASGWELTMDGQPHSQVTVNGLFRGAVAPAGTHVFSWRYRPVSLYVGALFSVIGIAIVIGESVLRRRKRVSFSKS